jgi:hypothetical protein
MPSFWMQNVGKHTKLPFPEIYQNTKNYERTPSAAVTFVLERLIFA